MNMLASSFSEVEASAAPEYMLSLALLRDLYVGQKQEIARYHSPLVVFHLTAKRWHCFRCFYLLLAMNSKKRACSQACFEDHAAWLQLTLML